MHTKQENQNTTKINERRGAYKQAKSAHFIFLFKHMRKCTELSKKNALTFSTSKLKGSVNIS